MGVSTNSQKDSKDNTHQDQDQELGLWVKPIHKDDCKTSMSENHHHNRMIITLNILSIQECDQDCQKEEQNQLGINNIIAPPVTSPSSPDLKLKKLKISSSYEVPEKNENEDDGFKTPTSLDHKIQPMLECPGARRKKITRMSPSLPMKRRLVFNLSKEVESMFTISFMEDVNKKLKSCK